MSITDIVKSWLGSSPGLQDSTMVIITLISSIWRAQNLTWRTRKLFWNHWLSYYYCQWQKYLKTLYCLYKLQSYTLRGNFIKWLQTTLILLWKGYCNKYWPCKPDQLETDYVSRSCVCVNKLQQVEFSINMLLPHHHWVFLQVWRASGAARQMIWIHCHLCQSAADLQWSHWLCHHCEPWIWPATRSIIISLETILWLHNYRAPNKSTDLVKNNETDSVELN